MIYKQSETMSVTDTYINLPDPVSQAAFYDGVAGKRLIAFLVDSVIIGLITAILIPLTAFVALIFFGFFGLIISIIYRTISLSSGSATPGMRLMGIEFRTHQGERLSRNLALAHTLFFHASLAAGLPQLISAILMATGARGQGLSDHILGTVAINRSAKR